MPTLKARIGGVWVDVGGGGGTDEVWIDPAAPAGTTQELWYDTDEPNLYEPDTARWNSAWGVVAVGTFAFSEGSTFIDGAAFTNPLSVPTLTTRRYRVRFVLRAVSASVAQGFYLQLTRDGTAITDRYNQVAPINFNQVHGDWLLQGTGVTNAYSVLFKGSTGSVGGYSSGGNFYVEDVGPVSMSSNPPAQPASVWTNVTFINGWTNFGGGLQGVQYRLVGDMVQVRGSAKNSTAIGTQTLSTIFTLPIGFRPPAWSILVPAMSGGVNTWGQGTARIEVNVPGTFGVMDPDGTALPHTILALDHQFSVSP